MRRTAIVVALVGSLLAGTAACSSSSRSADGHVSALTETSSSPPVVDSPTPTPSPSATKTPVKPKPTKTSPAPIIIPQQPGCAGYSGNNLTASKVSALLTSAQKVEEWKGLGESRVDPRMWPIPKIVVPLSMLKAIAYMESGWRTGCKGRDGIGFGLMQMSAATADQVNLRFGESFDRMTPAGNAALGVAYLEWIIATLGLGHFGTNFDITKNSKFMDAVIESYQQGPTAVLVDGHIEMNNPDYVTAVRAMMVSKPWA